MKHYEFTVRLLQLRLRRQNQPIRFREIPDSETTYKLLRNHIRAFTRLSSLV